MLLFCDNDGVFASYDVAIDGFQQKRTDSWPFLKKKTNNCAFKKTKKKTNLHRVTIYKKNQKKNLW